MSVWETNPDKIQPRIENNVPRCTTSCPLNSGGDVDIEGSCFWQTCQPCWPWYAKEVRRLQKIINDLRCCSFCGKTQREVNKMVKDDRGHHICDECVSLCNEMMAKEKDDE